MPEWITPRTFHEAEGVEDWRVLSDGAFACFRTGSLEEAAAFAQVVAGLPNLEPAQPDLDLRHDGVTVRLATVTDRDFGLSLRDVELARAISALARESGLAADPSALQSVLVIPGAARPAEVFPFWRAALGYAPRPDSPDEDLVDPQGRGPSLWFEAMDAPRPGGLGAVHVAVFVPHDQAQARLDAAVAAGGRVVLDRFAPAWVTLADAAGNEVDIATTHTRG